MPTHHPAPPPDAIAPPAEFAAGLRAALPGWDVTWLASTPSTNAELQQYLKNGGTGPALLGSHYQTSGRGRAGRAWQARAGEALLFSCGWQADIAPARLPPLSLVAGIAACEALGQLLGPYPDGVLSLKWPNDLQWNGAKLAGILVESVATPPPGCTGVVLGMGLNLRGAAGLSRTLGREIADWTLTGSPAGPARLVAEVAHAWRAAAQAYAAEGFAPFRERFARWDALYGQPVRIINDGRVLFEGTARGVDERAMLQVEDAEGRLQAVTVGDISVRAAPQGGLA